MKTHGPLGEAMAGKHSIAEAWRNLPSLIRDAEQGRTVEITRRGESVAILVGHREFERLTKVRRGFSASYREYANVTGLVGLGLDPDEIFGDVRDETAGQESQI